MGSTRALGVVLSVLLCGVIAAQVSARGSNAKTKWQTLSGDAPFVVAHGGFSGLFPDSSSLAYNLALMASVPNVILLCDVQLTKDGAGICFPQLKLDNSSDVAIVFPKQKNTYLVNGARIEGWFSLDFTLNNLSNVVLTQGVYSRSYKFDGNVLPILTVEDVAGQFKPPGLWLNIQHDAFYFQHNLNMRSYVLSVSRRVNVSYISSPEVNFLRSIAARFRGRTTKLVFEFLGKTEIEPTTNQTYDSLLQNLTFIRTFASGILVPKIYIWPVDPNNYLQSHNSVVLDAHKDGLEVFAGGFANDVPISYNYSYDPLAENLQFIDNGVFSVDGVLSDFPITPSIALDCFAHLGKNATKQVDLLVISNNGASGDYPSCTDSAYQKAIADGVDIIDCPVQMSKDGIPFCFSSINLINSSLVAQSPFSNRKATIPEVMQGIGIFSFSLTWDEIVRLTPQISSPFANPFKLFRNPNFKLAGQFIKLSDFLDLAKNASTLSGVLISIENAAYLAEKQGMSITDAVIEALENAGYNQTTLKVLIQSTNSSILSEFKGKDKYELVYKVDENIRDALNSTVKDIQKFAHSVVVNKQSVFPANAALFLTGVTSIVAKLQSFKLSVYVETFNNEFVSQAFDFFSDATVEINSFYMGAGIQGVITDFPKTAARYRRNRCLNRGNDIPIYMSPVQPGSLMQLVTPPNMPPTEAPLPVLTDSDVTEPPLPPVSSVPSRTNATAPHPATHSAPSNGQPKFAADIFLSSLAALLATLLLL